MRKLSPPGWIFAKLKHLLRKAAARTLETVVAAIRDSTPTPRLSAPTTSPTQDLNKPETIPL
jgi:hypothetical protein